MRLLWLLSLALTLCACKSDEMNAFESKADAALRTRAEAAMKNDASEVITVLGKASLPVDQTQRNALTSAGAEVTSVTGDQFTARVPARQMGRVASLSFVTQLQLSQVSQPLGQ